MKQVLTFITLTLLLFFSYCANDTLPKTTGNCLSSGTSAEVKLASGHTHTVDTEVTKEEVATGVTLNKKLQTSDSHTHDFTVSADRLKDLSINRGVGLKSTEVNGHVHDIIINCN